MPFYIHHLALVKQIIEKVAKYLVLPGLDLDVNINGKIVTLNNEIMIRLETPEDFQMDSNKVEGGDFSEQPSPASASEVGGSSGSKREIYHEKEQLSAITLRAEVNLADLLQDIVEVEGYVKHTHDITDQLLYAEKVHDSLEQLPDLTKGSAAAEAAAATTS